MNFNSIKVRLELVIFAASTCKNMNFNSIKVRLEHNRLKNDIYDLSVFQFHKGAIRTEDL